MRLCGVSHVTVLCRLIPIGREADYIQSVTIIGTAEIRRNADLTLFFWWRVRLEITEVNKAMAECDARDWPEGLISEEEYRARQTEREEYVNSVRVLCLNSARTGWIPAPCCALLESDSSNTNLPVGVPHETLRQVSRRSPPRSPQTCRICLADPPPGQLRPPH